MKKIWINGIYRDMTAEEEKAWLESHPESNEETTEVDNETALKDFFTALASGETNSIAKIRQLAKEFLERSAD